MISAFALSGLLACTGALLQFGALILLALLFLPIRVMKRTDATLPPGPRTVPAPERASRLRSVRGAAGLAVTGGCCLSAAAWLDRDPVLFAGQLILLGLILWGVRLTWPVCPAAGQSAASGTTKTRALATRFWQGLGKELKAWRANWRSSPLTAALLLFVGLLGLSLLMRALGPDTERLNQMADDLIRDQGGWGMLLYAVLVGVLSCFAVPRQALSFAGGFALGPLWGTVFATLGTTLGCALAFGAARSFARVPVERRYGPRIAKLNRFLSRSPLLMAMLLRLFPSGNNLLFSLMGGVTRMRAVAFIGGSLLGYIPQNLLFALLGSGIRIDPGWQIGLGLVLFVVVTGLGIWGYRLYQREA